MAILVMLALAAGFGLGFAAHAVGGTVKLSLDAERRKAFKALGQTTRALAEAERGLRAIANSTTGSPDLVAQNALDAVEGIRYTDTKDA